MNKSKIKIISEDYFKDNNLIESLKNKSEKRPYLYMHVKYNDNNLFIPFRTSLNEKGNLDKIINHISYDVSYDEKPHAKLDFSKMLIMNDINLIKSDVFINRTQYNKVKSNIDEIEEKAINYIQSYIKAYNKGRTHIDNKYKKSTLINYHKELGLTKIDE